MSKRIRIYMTGVGGQGTLTATTLLARVAVEQGVEVVAGEIHAHGHSCQIGRNCIRQ